MLAGSVAIELNKKKDRNATKSTSSDGSMKGPSTRLEVPTDGQGPSGVSGQSLYSII